MDNWNGIVSLLIACIELVLIINILIFAEKNRFNKITVVFLIVLMIYQVLEFVMCHLGYSSSFLAYMAFIDISFLPPLDLYLIYTFFIKKNDNLRYLFILPFVFIIYYALVLNRFEVASCTVFYAVYNYPHGTLFGVYYYLPIAASIFFLISYLRKGTVKKNIYFAGLLLTGHVIIDRKSTRLNSSHLGISYAVFCLKKKKQTNYELTCAVPGRGPPVTVPRCRWP